jgi:hypothetical protein
LIVVLFGEKKKKRYFVGTLAVVVFHFHSHGCNVCSPFHDDAGELPLVIPGIVPWKRSFPDQLCQYLITSFGMVSIESAIFVSTRFRTCLDYPTSPATSVQLAGKSFPSNFLVVVLWEKKKKKKKLLVPCLLSFFTSILMVTSSADHLPVMLVNCRSLFRIMCLENDLFGISSVNI